MMTSCYSPGECVAVVAVVGLPAAGSPVQHRGSKSSTTDRLVRGMSILRIMMTWNVMSDWRVDYYFFGCKLFFSSLQVVFQLPIRIRRVWVEGLEKKKWVVFSSRCSRFDRSSDEKIQSCCMHAASTDTDTGHSDEEKKKNEMRSQPRSEANWLPEREQVFPAARSMELCRVSKASVRVAATVTLCHSSSRKAGRQRRQRGPAEAVLGEAVGGEEQG